MDQPKEAVDHPAHYGGADSTYETIKVLAAWLTPDELRGFAIGNSIKYLSRAGKKGDLVEDLKKARWYLDYAIERESHRRTAEPGAISITIKTCHTCSGSGTMGTSSGSITSCMTCGGRGMLTS